MQVLIDMAGRGWFADSLVRIGIRSLVAERSRQESQGDPETRAQAMTRLLARMEEGPIAENTRAANAQHYEVPAEFFRLMLGPRLKYSSCYWPTDATTMLAAEEAMLALTCERAGLANGQRILELGCGWGSLTIWMAERFRDARITAVSNSSGQRRFIETECRLRGLENVEVLTADMNDFVPEGRFDRVVSVEMFEHMRNYPRLMQRIASWLAPGGTLFVHVFCHRFAAYFYEPSGPRDWMAREFFTGGIMPSDDLLLRFPQSLAVEEQWRVGGRHYQRTLEAWLEQLDENRHRALRILGDVYGTAQAARRLQRWRIFLMACSELFGFHGGNEWYVAHYRLSARTLQRVRPSLTAADASPPPQRESLRRTPSGDRWPRAVP